MLKPNSPVTANLIKARELIADENNWCRWDFGDSHGRHCAIGSVLHVAADVGFDGLEIELLGQVAQKMGYFSPADLNDTGGHAVALSMFDKAIELSLQD